MKKRVDFTLKVVILYIMNYAQEQLEYLEWKAQFKMEQKMNPCDIKEGVYALVDDDSPSESPIYFESLEGAVSWAKGSYPFVNGHWSVYRIGGKVL